MRAISAIISAVTATLSTPSATISYHFEKLVTKEIKARYSTRIALSWLF